MGINKPFIIEKIYDAPISKVWDAITGKDHMKAWYFNLAEFKAVPGFEFSFTAGDDTIQYVHICKVTEVIPGKMLSYTWAYEGYEGSSLVTFELHEENNKTILKLTHEGLETFPENNPSFAKESFAKGWEEILGTSLKNYLEK